MMALDKWNTVQQILVIDSKQCNAWKSIGNKVLYFIQDTVIAGPLNR